MAMALSLFPRRKNIKVHGKWAKCTGKELTFGTMAIAMMETTR